MAQNNIEKSLTDAEWHIHMADKAKDEGAPNRIQINYYIQALIRGCDALCWHYTGNRCESGRGHDLHIEFQKLYDKNELPQTYAQYKENLRKWVTDKKTDAQYLGASFSTQDVTRTKKAATRFLDKCVKPALRSEGLEIKETYRDIKT